jgi:hypothetical protein
MNDFDARRRFSVSAMKSALLLPLTGLLRRTAGAQNKPETPPPGVPVRSLDARQSWVLTSAD